MSTAVGYLLGCGTQTRPALEPSPTQPAALFAAVIEDLRLDGVRIGMPYQAISRLRPASRPRPWRGLAEVHGADSLVFRFAVGPARTVEALALVWVEPPDDAPLLGLELFRRTASDSVARRLWLDRLGRLRRASSTPVRCIRTRSQTAGSRVVLGEAADVRLRAADQAESGDSLLLRLSLVPSHDEQLRAADGTLVERWRAPAVVSVWLGPGGGTSGGNATGVPCFGDAPAPALASP